MIQSNLLKEIEIIESDQRVRVLSEHDSSPHDIDSGNS